MQPSDSVELGNGITCIDTDYIQPRLACFYLVQEGDDCAVIETGTVHSVPKLEALLAQRGIAPEQVRYIMPTHVHLDHAGGAGLMMQRFPEARCLLHPRGARHLVDPGKLIAGSRAVYGEARFDALYGEIVPVPAERIVETEDGQTVMLGDRPLLLRHTPGHADHHYCVWDARSEGWFAGDVFGVSYDALRTPGGDFSLAATTPSQFRPDALRESLHLLAATAPRQIYLTHYGALNFSRAVLERLLQQIDAFTGITRAAAGDPEQIEAGVIDHAMGVLRAMNPGQDVEALRASLKHDAALNAQGLATWYARETS